MARVSFTPVVYSQFKRKDGNYAVKMRITVNKKSRYITTSETATPTQLTRSLTIKDEALNKRLRELEDRMRAAIAGLDMYTLEEMSVDEVVSYMNKRIMGDFKLDFLAFWEEAVADKPKGSRENYMVALHSFQKFLKTNKLDISKLTSRLMRQYEEWLTAKHGKGARAVTMYTAAVKHVHSLARKRYNNDEVGDILIRNPFEFYVPPKQKPTPHRNVDKSIIQDMIDNRLQLEGRERRAVDAYLLSFALMGMNAPDLLSCKPPKKDILIYNRQKTRDRRADKAEMHVLIDERILPLYEEWAEHDKEHAFIFHRFHANHKQFTWALAKGLKAYRDRMGIPQDELDFYSARHTWASLAYSAGVDKSIINDCLCHVDEAMKVTDIYINKDWSILWEANRKVLDLFQWQWEQPSSQTTDASSLAVSPDK